MTEIFYTLIKRAYGCSVYNVVGLAVLFNAFDKFSKKFPVLNMKYMISYEHLFILGLTTSCYHLQGKNLWSFN